jgi:hypothetical protein
MDSRLHNFSEKNFINTNNKEYDIQSLRNEMLAHFFAPILGKNFDDYKKEIIIADLEVVGDNDVIDKITKDFYNIGKKITTKEIKEKIIEFNQLAKQKLENNKEQ